MTDRNYFSVYFSGTGTKTWTFAADRTILYSGVNIQGTTNVTFAGSSTLYDYGRWQNDSTGAFDAGNITVNFKNNAPMPIQGALPTTFYNVTISGSSTITQSQKITITGSLNVTSGTFRQQNDLVVQGALQNNGVFNAGTNTVTFNGSALQFISGSSAPTFYNVTIANANGVRFDHDVTINHNFVVNGGSSVQMGPGVTLTANGDFQNDGAFDVSNNDTTVVFGGTAAQSLGGASASIFKHLTINNTVGVNLNQDVQVRGNLTNNGAFNTGSRTVNFTGGSPQTIGGTTPITFNNLGIGNSTGVTFTQSINVNGTLTLNGDMFTGANTVNLASGATVTSNDMVFGRVRRAHTFVVDNFYAFNSARTIIRFNSGGTLPNDITVTLTNTKPAGLTYAVERTYNVTQNGGSGFSALLQLHYRDSELNGIPENTLEMWHYNGTRWVLSPKTGQDPYVNTIERNGVTDFSDWAMSNNGAPTSVTLSSFAARNNDWTPIATLIAVSGIVMFGIVWQRRKR